MKKLLPLSIIFLSVCVCVCGCGKKSLDGSASQAAPGAKVYDVTAVNQELQEGNVALNGTRQDFQAFFAAHPNYQLCTDSDAFSVGVIRNKKADPKADDIFIVANYRDGKIGGLDVTPQMFSAANLTSYCK